MRNNEKGFTLIELILVVFVLFVLVNFIVGVVLLLSGYHPGTNPLINTQTLHGNQNVAGFWRGLLHGMFSFFTFIASLFDNNVTIYEVHNNGGWYNFGFVLGIGGLSAGCSSRR